MCFNAGPLDRALRITAGIGLIVFGFSAENYLISALGLVPLLTGFIGFCPFYAPLKLNTGCKKN